MKDKFEASKRKQILISATALAGAFIIIVAGSTLLSGDAQKEKEIKQLEMPKVKYVDSDKLEKDSFKETYGKKVTSLEQKQDETTKLLKEITKKLDEKEKKDIEKKNEEYDKKNSSSSNLANSLGIQVPPLEDINNPITNYEDSVEQPKIERKIEEGLLVIEGTSESQGDDLGLKSGSEDNSSKTTPKKITIPSGSFVRATLLNGLDAPASANAKQEPHPVVLRITHNANLPNKYKSDIKECRAIGGGYGELSSERAIIRIESLSCIANDGTMYESKSGTVGFVTGEDGKIGLSGRVVTKQGAILARTVAAGFIEGMGEVFKESSTTVNTSGLGVTSTIDPNKAGQVGLYSGVGKGAEKVSEYYLKLNDQMFSVIEINLGRKGDILFNKAVVLEEVKGDKK